jgi:hypothetical protein
MTKIILKLGIRKLLRESESGFGLSRYYPTFADVNDSFADETQVVTPSMM